MFISMEDIRKYATEAFVLQKFKSNQFDFVYWNIRIDTQKYFKPAPGLSLKGEEVVSPTLTYCTYKLFPSGSECNDSPLLQLRPNRLFSKKGNLSPNWSRTMRSTFVSEWSIVSKSVDCPIHKAKYKKRRSLIKDKKTSKNRISIISWFKRLWCIP